MTPPSSLAPLPIDAHIEAVRAALAAHRAAVVVAPPGAGKTTRVPPALLSLGRTILLQPRRVAARAIARRIASEQGVRLGEEVGWQVRFERRFGRHTRLLVATEGVLTARLAQDPLLSDFGCIVIDEFHERSIHADLALALAKQATRARDDLRLVVMSATLDASPVARYLDDCAVIEAPGRLHPVEVRHSPGTTAADAVREILAGPGGHVLCFLPGAGEIRATADDLSRRLLPPDVRVLPLHGRLGADEQDAALAPSAERKVILATNVAETSLTVEGVSDVVDTGVHRVMRFDAERGLDRLETERIAWDSAEQRAGRAGRLGPGRAVRLWDPREKLRASRDAEITRVDLAAPVLDLLAWGGDPEAFDWYEAPPGERLAHAVGLLERLGAVRARRLTERGDLLRRLPLHPRLGTVLIEAGGGGRAAAACALLSERPVATDPGVTTDSDLLPQIDRLDRAPAVVRQAAREIESLAGRILGPAPRDESDERLLRGLLAGYPDRVAARREPGSDRLLLAGGHGARLARESGVRSGEFLVALDLVAGPRGAGAEALVRQASLVRREWLEPTGREVVHVLDEASGSVRAVERRLYGRIILGERAVEPEPAEAEQLLFEAVTARSPDEATETLLRRVRLAGVSLDVEALLRQACAGATRLAQVDLRAHLPHDALRSAEQLCPGTIHVPSGRRLRLDYRADGSVHLAVKLQELFGLADTPRVGMSREPIVIDLLAPNGRPVQTTRDLRSFWERTYPQVRKELRGRYPRHPWPEDPWTAEPTARTKRR